MGLKNIARYFWKGHVTDAAKELREAPDWCVALFYWIALFVMFGLAIRLILWLVFGVILKALL